MSEAKKQNSKPPEDNAAGPTRSSDGSVMGPGGKIGPYKLLRILGEGGYGIVYLAERQRPVKRRVALKVIKPGMDTKQVIARFEAERQALALLDHPNIAHVFNAGTTDAGRPYFAMEYVKGVPITEHCDRYKLTIEERLKVFMTVCEAVQYAHQKAIIHRDIKPSNILVAYEGEQAVPMIIDFGVAKALSQSLTERTLVTEQAQMVGTPEYMSPEQAEMTGQDIDTRTDVYSLGALLYELLTGTLPFDPQTLREAGVEGMRRMIREQDPKTPSVRLSTIEKDKSVSLAKHRRTDTRSLGRHLQGELDWITLKAMDKDRTRRYQTAYALAEDIQRYLNQEPVLAGPPSTIYKFRKFAARNKGVFVSVAAIAGVVILAAVVSIVLAIMATKAKVAETEQRQKAEDAQSTAEDLAKQREEDLYFNRIALAQRELQANRPAHALDLLGLCAPKLRNWEWHYLYRRCLSGPSDPLVFQSPVISFAFDGDGSRLAALCQDGMIRIRNFVTGREDALPVPGGMPEQTAAVKGWHPVQWVAFHPTENQLAVATGGNSVALIDCNSGELIRPFPGHSDRINAIAINPNGTQMATTSVDQTVRVWRLTDGSLQFSQRFGSWTSGVAFTPDGKRLITSLYEQGESVKVWDTETGKELNAFEGHLAPISNVAVSRDGSKVASCSSDQDIVIWDLNGGKHVRLAGHICAVGRAAFNSDGSRLISGSEDRTIRIWESATGREILELHQMPSSVEDLAFFPDGDKFLGGSHAEALTIWDGSPWSGEETSPHVTLEGHENRVLGVAFHPSQPVIASGAEDGTVCLWDVVSGRQTECYDVGGVVAFDVSFHPKGTHILSAGYNERNMATVDVWSMASPLERQTIATDEREIFGATFSSPDGRFAVYGGVNREIHVWDWKSKTLIGKLGSSTDAITKLAYSPDGRHLATSHIQGIVRLWDARRLTEPQEGRIVYRNGWPWLRPAFSDDSRLLALGDFEGSVTVLNIESGTEEYSIKRAHGEFVTCTAFSPD